MDDPWRSPDPLLQPLLDASRERFVLDPYGYHGPVHWQRVYHNGTLICAAEGIDSLVLRCFAFLHDSCRLDENIDAGHGARAASFAEELRALGVLPPLGDEGFELLVYACRHHSGRLQEAAPEVMACWDADRLDLLRVGIVPDPRRLCTPFAQREDTIDGACRRALDWLEERGWA
ncbi:MAG: hypothetical protein O2799_05265 [Planctomycetota bacterium]|nr:hypothetical protein [Planctomycetota bacterium]